MSAIKVPSTILIRWIYKRIKKITASGCAVINIVRRGYTVKIKKIIISPLFLIQFFNQLNSTQFYYRDKLIFKHLSRLNLDHLIYKIFSLR